MTLSRAAWVVALFGLIGCDPACLAQSDLFTGFRPALIEACCTCVAARGTVFPGSTCAEAILVDDVPVAPPDAGPSIPPDAEFFGDDFDDVVDDGEVPCLCSGDLDTCRSALNAGAPIVVTGACVSQANGSAPCEDACRGVLTFDPITAE